MTSSRSVRFTYIKSYIDIYIDSNVLNKMLVKSNFGKKCRKFEDKFLAVLHSLRLTDTYEAYTVIIDNITRVCLKWK